MSLISIHPSRLTNRQILEGICGHEKVTFERMALSSTGFGANPTERDFHLILHRCNVLAGLGSSVGHVVIHGQGDDEGSEVDLVKLAASGHLRRLDLIGPDLMVEPAGLASLSALTGLTSLVIQRVTVVNSDDYESESLKHISRLTELRKLTLHGNDLDNHAASVVGSLPLLELLDIETTRLILPVLSVACGRLVDLRLPKFMSVDDGFFEALRGSPICARLLRLELRGAYLDYEGVEEAVGALVVGLAQFVALERLDLGGCKLMDGEPVRIVDAGAVSALRRGRMTLVLT